MKKRTIALILCLCLAITGLTFPFGAMATEAGVTYGLDNLNNEEGTIKVAFLGGSITYGGSANPRLTNRYSTLVIENFFKEKFPNKTVEEINAGIGGTPSEYGVFRTYEHIAKHQPDVVFVEFAVNDEGYVLTETGKRDVRSNMEGIVRQLLELPKVPTIIFLYTHDTYSNGSTPLSGDLDASIAEHQKIADYYGIGTINLHEYIKAEEAKGTFVWYDRNNPASTTALTNDAVHPNNNGHKAYADYITSKFNENYGEYFKKPIMGKPHYERGYIFQNPEIIKYDNENVTYSGSWVKSHEAGFTYDSTAYPSTAWDGWILSKTPGDTATFTFTGRSIGISYGYSMIRGGRIKCTVDKGTENQISWETTLTPTSSESYSTTYNLISRNLTYGEHTLTVENVSTDATNCYIGFAHFLTDDGEPQSTQPVVGANDDYIPEGNRPKNLIAKPISSVIYTSSNSKAVTRSDGDVSGCSIKYTFDGIDGVAKFYYGTSFQIEGTYAGSVGTANYNVAGFNGYLPKGPTSYVMEFLANNTSPEGITPVMSAGIMSSGGTASKDLFSQEVTSRDKWQKVKGVVNLGCVDPTNIILQIGYATNSIPQLGTSFQIYNAATYVAEEVAFDISHESATGNNKVNKGGTIETQAKVLNQIYTTGNLPQNFTYKALSADRSQEVSGITVTSGNNGRATVSVDNTVEYGDYVILATSTDYPTFKKGFTITVADAPNYDDYIPGERDDNLIVNNQHSSVYTESNSNSVEKSGSSASSNAIDYTFVGKNGVPEFYYGTYFPVEGTHTGSVGDRDSAKNAFNGYLPSKSGTNYVMEMKLRNIAPDVNPTPAFAATLYTKKADAVVKTAQITETTGWQKVGFTIPVNYTTTPTDFAMLLGFATSSIPPLGTKVAIYMPSLYIAEEKAFDITSEPADGSVRVGQGSSIRIKSKVVNQVGDTGSLPQNFTYIALNDDRTEPAEGIIITAGENGIATVNVAKNTPAGNYVILAKSTDYPTMQKGLTINVTNTADYVPATKPANIIANNLKVNTFAGRWLATFETITPNVSGGIEGTIGYPIVASPQYWGDSSLFAIVGGDITPGINDYKFKANTNYVVSTDLKNHPDATVNGKFGYMIRTKDSNGNACQPAHIVDVTSKTDWQNFKFVLHVDYDGTALSGLYHGYPNHSSMHNPQGTYIQHRLGSLYIAEEVVYDITNRVKGNTNIVEKGDSIDLEASVINQIEIEGSLQQNFTWSALNEDRSEVVSGITITEGEEGNATVTVGNDVPAGKYVILAESDNYPGMRKGAIIEVIDFEGISKLDIDTSMAGRAYLNASVKTACEDKILFVIASYSGKNMIACNKKVVPVSNGEASVESLGIDVNAGETVRAFVWSTGLYPIDNPNGYSENVTIISADKIYGDELTVSSYDMPEVAAYLDNKKAAISITFDDGIYDAAVFYDNLFEKNNIKGTAMLVNDWLSENSIPKWQALLEKGNIEVGNHSKGHAIQYKTDNPTEEELKEDITGGYNALKALFPDEKIITFAPPWTQSTTASIAEISKNHYASRTSGTGFLSANPTEHDFMHIPALILLNTNTADELTAHIDTAIANESWFTVLMHGIGDGTYNIKEDVCEAFFNYIGSKKDDVWAGALGEIVQYMYEKQNHTINVNWVKENAMSLTLTDTLDNQVFDFPLTFKVNIPDSWNGVNVHQNGMVKTSSVFTENGKKYSYVNITPDKGEIILAKSF